MFKKENRTWLYYIGILIMLFLMMATYSQVFIPALEGDSPIEDLGDGTSAPSFRINTENDYLVELVTNYGSILIDLYEKNAPLNVNNFIYLAETNYYTRTKFHRLVPEVLLHGGDRKTLDSDPTNDGTGGPGYVIRDELNFKSLDLSSERIEELEEEGYRSDTSVSSRNIRRYSIVMANDGPDTNGSQFFIILANTDASILEDFRGKYTVIGQVISGFDILKTISQIGNAPTESNKFLPAEDIIIEAVKIRIR